MIDGRNWHMPGFKTQLVYQLEIPHFAYFCLTFQGN
jgi:hypothetical protein